MKLNTEYCHELSGGLGCLHKTFSKNTVLFLEELNLIW